MSLYFWKFRKAKWQKDRDDFMELTDENIKRKFIDSNFRERSFECYRNCLKERGYSLGDEHKQ